MRKRALAQLPALLPILLPVVLLATTAARPRDTVPAATPAGAPKSCIPLRSIRASHVHGDQVIDFEMNDRHVYRNTLPYPCSGLGFEERFGYATSLGQLCSTDIITVLRSGGGGTGGISRGPSCGLGQFQPVTLPKR
jgi:hypothetical protein